MILSGSISGGIVKLSEVNPKTTIESSVAWSNIIYSCAITSTSVAMPALVQVSESTSLQQTMLGSLNSSTFMKDLGKNLYDWWKTVTWLTPGFSAINVVAPPLNTEEFGNKVMSGEIVDFPVELEKIIIAWFLSTTLTITNTATGATFPSNIV